MILARRQLVGTTLALLLAAGCNTHGYGAGDVLPHAVPVEDLGWTHVRGMGVNPANGQVYVATDLGLWRLPEHGAPERVGSYAYDFSGFTVIDKDHFIASGHPQGSDELPPDLGLIESTDGGLTWHSVSLLGDADLHILRERHGTLYGWNAADEGFLFSEDRKTWQVRSTQPAMLDFVIDPEDPDRLLASFMASRDQSFVLSSDDGGRSWRPTGGPQLTRLAWSDPDRLWGVPMDGRVWRSTDGGMSWLHVGAVDCAPEALYDAEDRLLLAHAGGILESTDDGATWRPRYRLPQANRGCR